MILTVVIAMPMPLWQGLAHRRMLKLPELFLCSVQLRMGLALAIAIVRLPAHLCKHFSAHCGKKQNLQCSLNYATYPGNGVDRNPNANSFILFHQNRTSTFTNTALALFFTWDSHFLRQNGIDWKHFANAMSLHVVVQNYKEGWNTPLSKWKWPSNDWKMKNGARRQRCKKWQTRQIYLCYSF